MFPVYLTKQFAFVPLEKNPLMLPHFNSLSVLRENLKEITRENVEFLSFESPFEKQKDFKKYQFHKNEIFVSEISLECFEHVAQFVLGGIDESIVENYFRNVLVTNYPLIPNTDNREFNLGMMRAELFCFSQKQTFPEELCFTGLPAYVFSGLDIVRVFADVYAGEGFVKVHSSIFSGKEVEGQHHRYLAGVFFTPFNDVKAVITSGVDNKQKFSVKAGEISQINLGKEILNVDFMVHNVKYSYKLTGGEHGIFIDTRNKPLNSFSRLERVSALSKWDI